MMKKILVFAFILFSLFAKGDYWTQKPNFPGLSRWYPFSFVIGMKGYVGTGSNCNFTGQVFNDFWQYDASLNIWTQKADFGGCARWGATGFSIQNKGYAGLGGYGNVSLQDYWEYDPALNSWSTISDFAGSARWGAVSFVLGNSAYVGTGSSLASSYYNDFFAYDPITDTWQQKASVGYARTEAIAYSDGIKGYLGTGASSLGFFSDFSEYDPVTNLWTSKATFPYHISGAVAFSIGGTGYLATIPAGSNQLNGIWEYSTTSNNWTQKANLIAFYRHGAVGFTIGNKAYVGLGGQSGSSTFYDFWEYTPGTSTGLSDNSSENFTTTIYPNPFHLATTLHVPSEFIQQNNCSLNIFDASGKKVLNAEIKNQQTEISMADFDNGIYLYEVRNKNGVIKKGKVVKE